MPEAVDAVKAFWKENRVDLHEVTDRGVSVAGCSGEESPQATAMYCQDNNVLYYSTPLVNALLAKPSGDVAVQIIAAHELGHALQDFYSHGAFSGEGGDRRISGVPAAELSADCFAGMYMESTGIGSGMLSDGLSLTKLNGSSPRIEAFYHGTHKSPDGQAKQCFADYE